MKLDDANLEHCLYQKLTLMANAVARISSVKSQLRNSAERTRKDISNAIDHQLSCVRAREQELIYKLERTVAEKEQILSEQQEQLNQAIGACQQSLECLLRDNGTDPTKSHYNPATLSKMLFKMNSLELRPKDSSQVLFEFDPSDLRRDISVFGKILSVDHHQAKAAESLPMDVEHYEDDALLSHKSVLRISQTSPKPPSLPSSGDKRKSNFAESINYWLAQVKSLNVDGEDCFDADFLRDPIDAMSSSSFDIINTKDDREEIDSGFGVFEAYFSEINEKPLSHWLLKRADTQKNISELVKEIEMKIRGQNFDDTEIKDDAAEEIRQQQSFAFEKVIRSIQMSRNEDWLLQGKREPLLVKSDFAVNHEENDDTNWFRRFPNLQSMKRKPTNETDEFSNLESVVAWKKILEKFNSG